MSSGRKWGPSRPRIRLKYSESVQSRATERSADCHVWRWLSISPGSTMRSRASITSASAAWSDSPIAAIRGPSTSTSARRGTWPGTIVTTRPPRISVRSIPAMVRAGEELPRALGGLSAARHKFVSGHQMPLPPARGRWVGHDPEGGFGQTFTGWNADQPNLADTPTMLERALVRYAAVDILVDLDVVVERLSLLLAPLRVAAVPPPPRGGRGI